MNENTTHTIQYEQPSALSAIPLNKAAQFALGVVMILVGIKLYWSGWFSESIFEATGADPETDVFGSPIGLIPFAIDAVCLVGLAGFALLGFIRGAIGPLFGGMREWMANASAKVSATRAAETTATVNATDNAVTRRDLDPKKLNTLLNTFRKRLDALEALHPELTPDPEPKPPTLEELAAKIAELEAAKAKPTTRKRSTARAK